MKPVIYQLVVRYFGNVNATNRRDGSIDVNGCGRFEDVSAPALGELRRLGATHVWLTGCLRQATLTDYSSIGLPPDAPDVVKGIAGSFYAVRDCFDVSPDYARVPVNRLGEFEAMVRRVHDAGMKALIDFVPNHVARGYESVVRPESNFGRGDDTSAFFKRDNHFFYLVEPPGQKLKLEKPAHWNPPGVTFNGGFYPREDGGPGRPPKATGDNATSPAPGLLAWYETVKLNYGFNFVDGSAHYAPRPRTWDLMDEVLAYWQGRGVDGFRCDFAHYVPAEAWAFLIGRARQRQPSVYFFAEAYPWAGSGDPVTDSRQLTEAGFDAVYHHHSYNHLKGIYQGTGGQDQYHEATVLLSAEGRRQAVMYLENHDERRIASPVVLTGGPGDSGFGSAAAGYQLAPLQFLCGPGPVLLLNGQEVGEPAIGAAGYAGDNGRTTLFDYWSMPEFAKWVNGHAYDGGLLSAEQKALRTFYAALLELCQDPAVRADGYWGLKYFNRPELYDDCSPHLYTFARFADGGGRIVLVVTNFNPGGETASPVRIPAELAAVAGLGEQVSIRLCLDRRGRADIAVADLPRARLIADGFDCVVPNQTSHVYVIE
ncbi:MAG TPA: alpha-amylase family glycosyl hydrolase [Tepidisphaeraceae bacterium]|nr:alpha-amylase family glycosyl hydrolase [Tepidisphaeraceae bacterium]